MTRIKKLKEHDVVEDFIEKEFYWLLDPRYGRSDRNDIIFLKSLNLTMEQYKKLADMMNEYAMDKYGEGCNNSF